MIDDENEYAHEHLAPHKKSHSLDSWRLFRIMAEFVDGFENAKREPDSACVRIPAV